MNYAVVGASPVDQQPASEKPSLQKQRVPQFVYEAKFTHIVFTEDKEGVTTSSGTQLMGAVNLRKALVKFERWADAQGLRDVDLMSLAVKSDVVI